MTQPPAARPRRRLSSAERREAILDAALPVFASESYDRASLRSLAQAAGVTKPVLYDHFSSKSELYIALLERESQHLVADIGAAFEPNAQLDERLRAIAHATLRFVRRRPDAARVLFRTPDGDEPARAAHQRIRSTARHIGATAILADSVFAAKPGLSRRASAELIADLHGAVLERTASWALEHPSTSTVALTDLFVDVLWNGLR